MRLLIATAILLTSTLVRAATYDGRVVAVTDGDTITVLDASKTQHKIRLADIDAPEKAQPFGQRAKQSLSDLVFDKTVTVETGKTDRYGREVGKALVDGLDANLEQIKRGLEIVFIYRWVDFCFAPRLPANGYCVSVAPPNHCAARGGSASTRC